MLSLVAICFKMENNSAMQLVFCGFVWMLSLVAICLKIETDLTSN
jgi:hypothetical protein